MEFRQPRRHLNRIRCIGKTLKLTKNGKRQGENYINTELYKRAPEEFKLRLLKFLNNIYKKNIQNEWRNASVIPVFKNVTEETLKITEEIVF